MATPLTPLHYEMLRNGSSIQDEVITARGYFTASTPAEMEDLGFAPNQCRAPSLILPMYDRAGQGIGYVARPDSPREDAKKPGKLIKYEYPARHPMRLDCCPTTTNLAQLHDPTVPLVITEGIRKADSAVSRGACVVTLNGVWAWITKGVALPDWDSIPLRGRQVYLAFDSDVMDKPDVHMAMQGLGNFLTVLGATPRYVYLPPGSDGAKVGLDDFFVQGHTLTDLWRCAEETLKPAPVKDGLSREPILRLASEAEEKELEWLWWPYLPRGVVATLEGDPSVGKSTLTIWLASVLSRGGVFPDQYGVPSLPSGPPQNSIFIAAEDSLEHVIKKRLRLANADQRRIAFLEGWKGKEDEVYAFQLQYADVLDNALTQRPSALVVIDPIQAYVGNIDMNQASQVTPLLAALGKIAEKHRCTILLIRHLAKGTQGGKAMHRALASVAFTATARTALIMEQHPNGKHKDLALLCHSKTNGDFKGRTQIFQRRGDIAWCGVSRLTDEHVMGNARGADPALFVEVSLWLEERLKGDLPWLATDIEQEASEEGYKHDVLWRAKKALGVKSLKEGMNGQWRWKLPALELLSPPILHTLPHTSYTSYTSNSSEKSMTYPEGYEVYEDLVGGEDLADFDDSDFVSPLPKKRDENVPLPGTTGHLP